MRTSFYVNSTYCEFALNIYIFHFEIPIFSIELKLCIFAHAQTRTVLESEKKLSDHLWAYKTELNKIEKFFLCRFKTVWVCACTNAHSSASGKKLPDHLQTYETVRIIHTALHTLNRRYYACAFSGPYPSKSRDVSNQGAETSCVCVCTKRVCVRIPYQRCVL